MDSEENIRAVWGEGKISDREAMRRINALKDKPMNKPWDVPVVALVLSALCYAGTAHLPMNFYTVLRWAVVLASVVLYVRSRSVMPGLLLGVMGYAGLILIILFNPITPIPMEKSTWAAFDMAAGAYFLLLGAATFAHLMGFRMQR